MNEKKGKILKTNVEHVLMNRNTEKNQFSIHEPSTEVISYFSLQLISVKQPKQLYCQLTFDNTTPLTHVLIKTYRSHLHTLTGTR